MKPLLLGAGFIAGLLAADFVQPSPQLALVIGSASVVCLICAWLLHRSLPEPDEGELLHRLGAVPAAALLLGCGGLGFVDLGVRLAQQGASPLPLLDGRVVQLEGRLASDPQPVGRSWVFTLSSIVDESGQELAGRLAVRSYRTASQAALGDLVLAEVKIGSLDPEDLFDRAQARRGISAEASLLSPVRVVARSESPLVEASNFFRERMRSGAAAALSRNRAALLLGLTIGDDRALSERVREDFRASGLSHLTAVSGANVAIVLGALAALLGLLKASRRLKTSLGFAAIVFFAVITRWEPSVLRASVMAAIALGAFLFGRKSNSIHVLGVALFGLLIFDPLMLWSVGFQLSFAATAGILLGREPLLDRLRSIPRLIAEPLAIGLSAQAAVFPLIAVHFGKISIASVPANLAAAGMVAPATVLGLLAGVVATMSEWLAGPAFKAAGIFVTALEWVAKTFGRSDLSQVSVPNFGSFELIAACLGLVAAWLWMIRRSRWARWPAVACAVVAIGSLIAPAAGSSAPSGLRITFFDVGQGDSALVESPGGARVLVDGGPDPELIADTLGRHGLGRIDLLVASHLHADHVVGLAEVAARLDVGIALHPGVETPLLESLERGRGYEAATEGERIVIGDLTIELLGPSPEARAAAVEARGIEQKVEGSELNDASVVLRVLWGGECVLFTGDLEETGQQELLDEHRSEIDCTVLKAPHHGSGRLLKEFVQAVDPEWVAVSVGRNRHGHPTEKALEIFEAAGAEVQRTDRQGDIVLEIDGAGRVMQR
ncbi:MAG: ComEC/Rec2 family competence protein [Actinomycetota bacterium]